MSAIASTTISALLTTTAPACTIEEAQDLVRAHFGIDARARLLTSERDQNFHLATADGDGYLLKIANSAEDPAVTNLQTEALLHVAATNPALPIQRVIPTLDGRYELTRSFGADAAPCVVRLLSYVPGEPLHKTIRTPAQVRQLARCLAELDLALRGFFHPAAGHELLWDLKHAARLRDLVETLPELNRRGIASRFLDRFEQYALPVLPKLRAQVIHNDFNPHNLLVDPNDHERVTGIIDFGDIVHAPLVNDVAVAAAYQVPVEGSPLDAAAEFVAAYHAAAPLEPAEVDILFDLIAVRQVLTVAITEWRANRYPANSAYILRNNPRAWTGLESFSSIPRSDAQALLRRACGME
jgi:Ser/Thr protein kinase RdoA (MazF antagonist)